MTKVTTFSKNIDYTYFDTKGVTNMDYMFGKEKTFNQDISSLETSKVLSMKGMLSGCHTFNRGIGWWNVGRVGTMESMFEDAYTFNKPLGEWNVCGVETMENMFRSCYTFNQPLGEWDTGNVRNMSRMFSLACAFNQPIGEWYVGNVLDMSYMFEDALSFNQDLNMWRVGNVRYMYGIFFGAKAFNPQNIKYWILHKDVRNGLINNPMYLGIRLPEDVYNSLVCNQELMSIEDKELAKTAYVIDRYLKETLEHLSNYGETRQELIIEERTRKKHGHGGLHINTDHLTRLMEKGEELEDKLRRSLPLIKNVEDSVYKKNWEIQQSN